MLPMGLEVVSMESGYHNVNNNHEKQVINFCQKVGAVHLGDIHKMVDIQAETKDLLSQLGFSQMSSTAYDTAWLARLSEFDSNISNQALEWLCENQLSDGSWGTSEALYYHDRVICTLGAMISLTYRGRRAQDRLRIQNGLEALDRITSGATQGLRADLTGATVGFELVVPTLISEAENLGIIKQQGDRILGRLSRLRETKMSKLAGMKFSRHITVAHSAEMAGTDKIDLLDIENLQEPNGSVGNSPSATAYFATKVCPGDNRALQYLHEAINKNDSGAPTLFPIELFERNWVLWNLSLANLQNESAEINVLFENHLDFLEKHWKPGNGQGLGFSNSYSLTDSDDTAVGFELLSQNGRRVDINPLLGYEEEQWFRCFQLEANPSVDVNVHALNALRQAGYEKNHPVIQKIISFVRSRQQPEKYWFDKWHISPYYTTAHVAICCGDFDNSLSEDAVNWILKSQKADGSWGFFGLSTAEETAYCIQALVIWEKHGSKLPRGRVELAKDWLTRHAESPYPALWIDKSLYRPELLVKSVILSALKLAEE